MSNQHYTIRIPEPCSENWNTMQPDEKGRFCSSCSKSVHDFSNKTDAEIHQVISSSKDKHICGYFRKSQIDRPLNISVPVHLLPTGLSQARAFAIALFLVFGTLLISCTDDKGKEVNKIELVHDEPHLLGAPIPQVEVQVPGPDSIIPAQEIYITENMVAGGISYERFETVEPVPAETIQPVMKEETTEKYMLGEMLVYHDVIRDSIIPADTATSSAQRVIANNSVKEFSLTAFPNPTNGSVTISYEIVRKGIVNVDIYSLEGAFVQNVIRSQEQYAGKYVIPTDLTNLPNGVYICRIMNEGNAKTTKIVVAK